MIHESNNVDSSVDCLLSGVLHIGDDRNQYVVHGLSAQQTESDKRRMEVEAVKVKGWFLVGSW